MAGLSDLVPGASIAVEAAKNIEGLNQMQAAKQAQSRLQAAAPELAKMAASGDIQGAFARLIELDPSIAKDPLAEMFKVNPQFRGQQERAGVEAQLSAQSAFGANPRQLLDAQLAFNARENALERQKALQQPKLTPGEEQYDKEAAKDFVDFDKAGGYTGIKKQLEQLNFAKQKLSTSDGVSGGLLGTIGFAKPIRDILFPSSGAVQDSIQDTVFKTLRATLGSQFTEKEGARLIENTFNPRQPEKENLRRLNLLIKEIDGVARAKADQIQHFKQYGTLKDYTPPSVDDFIQKVTGTSSKQKKYSSKEVEAAKARIRAKRQLMGPPQR